jgi:oligopeptide transport system substrate-binding protein
MHSCIKLILISTGGFVLLISGCEQPDITTTPEIKSEAPSGVLRIPLNGVVGSIDPGFVSENNQTELIEQLFLGLTDFDQDSKTIIGELATGWQVSEDGTVYTFNLRRNVKWTDGVPVTAHDIVWAIRRNFLLQSSDIPFVILKNVQAMEEALFQIMDFEGSFYQTGAVHSEQLGTLSLGVRAVDHSTVEFTLEQAVDTIDQDFHEFVEEQVFQALIVSDDTDTQPVVPTLMTDNWQKSQDGAVYTLTLPQNDIELTQNEQGLAHQMVEKIRYIFMEQASPFDRLQNANIIPEAIYENQSGIKTQFLKSGEIRLAMEDNQEKIISLGVRAIDDYTVQFTLEHADASFLALVSTEAFRPLPRHIIEKYDAEWTAAQNLQTNGSYKLAKWEKGNHIFLTKNPDYYEADKVNIQEVHYHIVPESSIGLAMYENEALDIIGGPVYLRLPQTEIPRILTNPKLANEMHIGTLACTEWYGFNTQRAPTDNLLVRKAIAAAIDKQLLVEIVVKGSHIPAMTLVHPVVYGALNFNEVSVPFNPEQAKAWLKEAGYPKGVGFPKIVLMHPINETHKQIAGGLKTLLKHFLNIDIDVHELDWKRYNNTVFPLQPGSENSPHIFRYGGCFRYPDAITLLGLFHSNYSNNDKDKLNWISQNNSESFDKTVDKARRATMKVKHKELSQRAEQLLIEEDVAIIPLYFSKTRFLVKSRVKGWHNMVFGGQHIRDWSLED